jgi:hypothetical protein
MMYRYGSGCEACGVPVHIAEVPYERKVRFERSMEVLK